MRVKLVHNLTLLYQADQLVNRLPVFHYKKSGDRHNRIFAGNIRLFIDVYLTDLYAVTYFGGELFYHRTKSLARPATKVPKKSINTGLSDCKTSLSKLALFTSMIAILSYSSTIASMSLLERMRYFSPSSSTSVPEYLPIENIVPYFYYGL